MVAPFQQHPLRRHADNERDESSVSDLSGEPRLEGAASAISAEVVVTSPTNVIEQEHAWVPT